jgi:hypothetical protein
MKAFGLQLGNPVMVEVFGVQKDVQITGINLLKASTTAGDFDWSLVKPIRLNGSFIADAGDWDIDGTSLDEILSFTEERFGENYRVYDVATGAFITTVKYQHELLNLVEAICGEIKFEY